MNVGRALRVYQVEPLRPPIPGKQQPEEQPPPDSAPSRDADTAAPAKR